MRNIKWVWLGLTAITLAGGGYLQWRFHRDLDHAKAHFVAEQHNQTQRNLTHIDTKLSSIYQNLRTLASLPALRGIDRQGKNMSAEARTTFQLIYNTLAELTLVSEVYVTPIDFNPARIDPETQKLEEPIVAFDQLIVNAGSDVSRVIRQTHPDAASAGAAPAVPEVEEFEYRQIVEQAAWFKAHYPRHSDFEGLNVPFTSGPEVITCDNTRFITSGKDADRSGIIFSVPFYDQKGDIKGLVSGIVLTNALRQLISAPNLALVNPSNGYLVMSEDLAKIPGVEAAAQALKPEAALLYSEALPLSVRDARSPWHVWAAEPNASFLNGSDFKNARDSRHDNMLALATLALAAAACLLLVQRNLKSARDSAEKLQALNDDISRLNTDLAQKLAQLSLAQDAIVKSGRMAQLGQLVATVAHEIRNPLGSVRTTSFALKRKLTAMNIDVSSQMNRIESGVTRCVHIINQLLDFSRSQDPQLEPVDLCRWVQTVIEDEIQNWPEQVQLQLNVPETGLRAHIDTERMRRCIINLVSNACEALTHKTAPTSNPRIVISLSQQKRGYEIAVQDNGPGIPADMLARIGEPLFTTKNFGTGLGIAATRKVAELHGGGLDVSSVPGQGACFVVWFSGQAEALKAA